MLVHPRHARVGRDARGGARRGHRRGRRRRPARRRAADAGRAAADRAATASTSASFSRPRTTPCATTASSSSAPTATSSSDAAEEEIEALLDGELAARRPSDRRRHALHGTLEDYLRELHARFADLDLPASTSLLDCANGATYRAAPEIFRRLGAHVTCSPTRPTGATSTTAAARRTSRRSPTRCAPAATTPASPSTATATACWPSTATGAVVDGDELIALAALHLRAQGRLPGDGVAVTVMTNYGFHTAMAAAGIEVATTAVGDRYVLEALRERGWALGGEQSGPHHRHGLRALGRRDRGALLTLEALAGGDLAERDAMEKLPQRSSTCACADRAAVDGQRRRWPRRRRASRQALEGRGRVLVRAVGHRAAACA